MSPGAPWGTIGDNQFHRDTMPELWGTTGDHCGTGGTRDVRVSLFFYGPWWPGEPGDWTTRESRKTMEDHKTLRSPEKPGVPWGSMKLPYPPLSWTEWPQLSPQTRWPYPCHPHRVILPTCPDRVTLRPPGRTMQKKTSGRTRQEGWTNLLHSTLQLGLFKNDQQV